MRVALGAVESGLVLDVGCGTGRFGMVAQETGARVVGLDRSAAMVAAARHRLAPVLVADAQRLPLGEACFDATLAVTVLEFVADPERVVSEMVRTTVPGGSVVIGTLNPHSPWGWAHRAELRRRPWTDARFLSGDELVALASPHGDVQTWQGLFAPGWLPGLDRVGAAVERASHRLGVPGAFRVTRIRRPSTSQEEDRG
ncbi:MAG: class I SAM-dependent methyltransferase [Nitriliruptoraceae bacterium]